MTKALLRQRGELVARFADVFDEVGADAVARESERRLPFEEVVLLKDRGFTRVTLPVELGGDAASHQELFELLAELARRDANLAQLFRSHFSFIDRALHSPIGLRDARLARLAGGATIGNATHERSSAKVGTFGTRLTRDEQGLRLDGTKYYSTGTIFADFVGVAADDGLGGDQDGFVSVVVSTTAPGVTVQDDWRGFGQKMTGSGTTVFENVRVTEADIIRPDRSVPTHSGAFVQLVLLATVAGIGRAIVDDATTFVTQRTRVFSHGSAATAREDPIVQELVGDLSGHAFAADAALASAVDRLAESSAAILADADSAEQQERIAAVELTTARAQLVILPNVLQAATTLFEVGGASATDSSLALDRHWRNARTIASHNPTRYKARIIGDQLLNDTPIAGWWSAGEA